MPSHKTEKAIVFSSCIVTLLLLFKGIPKDKQREAHVSFLAQQVLTWLFGLIVVENTLIKYPYRPIFKKSNKSSFPFEYFIYPSLTALYNTRFPEQGNWFHKMSYTFFYSGAITIVEVLTERYTSLITYKKWKWYWSFLTLSLTYYATHLYYCWFFHKGKNDAPKKPA